MGSRVFWRSGLLGLVLAAFLGDVACAADHRPNVVWITAEDHGPHLGCYGDPVAVTPNLDRLAARGLRYERCWSVCPVCAPARTALITGMYPSSLGAEHMRSMVPMPQGTKLYPQLLREAGYHCTNNSKEDYNVSVEGRVWDESSNKAHWKSRQPGQPFFAIFNFTGTHESRMHRMEGKAPKTDPAKVRVPAYHPDLPAVRTDWAHYHDGIRESDKEAGRILAELESDGLAEDTVVFYFADHGPGLARSKRSACDSGLRVPLIVWFPEKFRHLAPPEYQPGAVSERLVSFVDFAPTLLSLCGITPPRWMQGAPFAGANPAEPHSMLFGSRGRMDERHDLVRCVTDGRYVYVRNLLPHLPHGQHVEYQFKGPLTRAWHDAFSQGKTNPAQSAFWMTPRPAEELYDLQLDPDETWNLAASTEVEATLRKFRAALEEWTLRRFDLSLWPESEMLGAAAGGSPQDRVDSKVATGERNHVAQAAYLASLDEGNFIGVTPDKDFPAVRYWNLMRVRFAGVDAMRESRSMIEKHLTDPSPAVRIAAAELSLLSGGNPQALTAIVRENPTNAAVLSEALSALERSARYVAVAEVRAVCEPLPDAHPAWNKRVAPKIALLRDRVLAELKTR
jgi:arylsulfatase A-like enzyme